MIKKLAAEAAHHQKTMTRAKIRGPALEFVAEVLRHNDTEGNTPITLSQVRKALASDFGILVTDGAIIRTVQTKLGRSSWVNP